MRRILIVSLLLVPMLFTAPAVADMRGTDATAQTLDLRVSSGVAAPDLVYSTSIDALPGDLVMPYSTTIVVSFDVDEKGTTSDFQVVNPTNPILEDHVISAVSKFRFPTAMLDNQPIPLDMNWTVEVGR